MTKDKKSTIEYNLVIEALEKRIKDLEECVKNLLADKVKEFEDREAKSETNTDLFIERKRHEPNKIENTNNCNECEEIFADKRSLRVT